MEVRSTYVLITGSNRGIGRAVAKRFAQDQCHLILANRTQEPSLVDELKKAGALSVEQVSVDLNSQSGIARFIEANKDRTIDILFNNAGQLTGGLIEEQPINDIYSMFQVNVNALVHLCHGFLPAMIKRGRGKIINHASVSAVMPFPCASTYAASKAAVLMFTRCLQTELKGTGVSTLALVTPSVETEMFKEIPKLYGKSLDVSFLPKGMPPQDYAEMIREAVIADLEILEPTGTQGIGVTMAKYLPGVFRKVVLSRFKRSPS